MVGCLVELKVEYLVAWLVASMVVLLEPHLADSKVEYLVAVMVGH